MDIGFASFPGSDEPFVLTEGWFKRHPDSSHVGKPYITGDNVREWSFQDLSTALVPYDKDSQPIDLEEGAAWSRHLWKFRRELRPEAGGGWTSKESAARWWTWYRWVRNRYLARPVITFNSIGTHQHCVIERGGHVFNRHAPVINLTATATEDDHLALLGVLNSSTACFWLKQVSHNKGSTVDTKGARQTQAPWEDFYEFTGTKLEQLPLPATLPVERGHQLDELAQSLAGVAPGIVLDTWRGQGDADRVPLGVLLDEAGHVWAELRARMIFQQDELDWQTYQLYGLLDSDVTYGGTALDRIDLGQRAFELVLADGSEEDLAWFARHGSTPITEIPTEWPEDYRTLVLRRLDLIESDPDIRLLEKPEFKRRWAVAPWEAQVTKALQTAILDRLEAPELWRDGQGPAARSVAELADALKGDAVLLELVSVLTGDTEADLVKVLASLVTAEAVPYLAARRYKPAGLEKFRTWQQVWEFQRREDAGEKVDIPVPLKYSTPDFRKVEYWKARGKLDVPKERFILYPDLHREGDSSIVLGWAGWDHKDQALALAREFPTQDALGAGDDLLTQMAAGLVELEPWVHQWHSEMDASFGVSPAQAVTGVIDQQLGRLEATRDEVTAWTPPVATRGRRPKNS